MSFTVTTDVDCDACSDWIHGCTGKSRREAWKNAKAQGWTKDHGQHLCPLCNGSAKLKLLDGTYVFKEPFKLSKPNQES